MASDKPIGLIAGEGKLPLMVAQGIRSAGNSVACVGLRGQFDCELPALCDRFSSAGIIRLGRWIRLLRRWGVEEAILVGRVRKARMYEPWRLFRQMPDWRAAKLWYRVLRHDKRSGKLLGAVADELQFAGIRLIDSTRYIPDQLAQPGVLSRKQPSPDQLNEIEFAWPLLTNINALDIGQSIAVKDREVIAIEAIEGTDALIQRAGALCRRGRWMLLKAACAGHDMRFDVPTVGMNTIELMHQNGGTCLVVQAGKVILAEKPQLLELANRYGIVVVAR